MLKPCIPNLELPIDTFQPMNSAMKTLKIILPSLLLVCMALLSGCSRREPLPLIVLHPHEDAPADIRGYTSVFLAGTIDMGASDDWQKTAAELFRAKQGSYLLFNPRQDEWHPEREGEMDYQVSWELEHLESADYILMNILPGSLSPISLLELGLHARDGKLLVVCTPEYSRYDNVRITCARYSVPVFSSLEGAVNAIKDK